jgi:20S proteasome subunit beta 2
METVVDEDYPLNSGKGGFDMTNALRNEHLAREPGFAAQMPIPRKTGTTICGVVFAGGVVLGADTRATGEVSARLLLFPVVTNLRPPRPQLIVDKNCAKLHYIANNIYCAGAGTAADCVMTTANISAQLELLRLNTSTSVSRVITAVTIAKRYLFQYQGAVSAALVLGGVDHTGGHLYSIYPHGSTDKLPFTSMGSGSLAAMSVLESRYKDDLTEQEAMSVVTEAIRGGVFNDLGSGSNVDLVVIRQGGNTSYLRNYQTPNEVSAVRARVNLPFAAFRFPVGSTPILAERVEVFTQAAVAEQAMEVEVGR